MDAHQEMMNMFAEMQQEFSSFEEKSQLKCLTGCGQCCLNPGVETTVLEVLPLAQELFRLANNKVDDHSSEDPILRQKAQSIIDHCDELKNQSSCMIYQPDEKNPHQGRCGFYNHRPSLCRIFGQMSSYDKWGNKRFSVCKLIKEHHPQRVSEISQDENLLSTAPHLSTWFNKIKTLSENPEEVKLRPINQAIYLALMKVGLFQRYTQLHDQAGVDGAVSFSS